MAELKEVIDAREFIEWQAYFELHPFGVEWDDVRMAVLSANICYAFTGKKQDPEKHRARYKKVRQTANEVQMMARMMKAQNDRLAAAGKS